ncbi:MAG: extracellular solute-binding protein [Gemmataceae bacterium]|nr:extracellular solute-binding protein [Gemmataceae bacterium]
MNVDTLARTIIVGALSRWLLFLSLGGACIALSGCPSSRPDGDAQTAPIMAGKQLRLLVVNEPRLADSVRTMAEEFRLQTSGELHTDSLDSSADKIDPNTADVFVYPTERLPELAAADALRVITPRELTDPELNWQDLLPSAREHDAMWGTDVVAVPLGTPVLALFYRADQLKQIEREAPRTWREYGDLVTLLAKRASTSPEAREVNPLPTIEPWTHGWRGWMLLARAASYARHPDYYSTVFDLDTLDPRLTSPPIVRALEEMAALPKDIQAASLKADPAAALETLFTGRAAVAVGWPQSADPAFSSAIAPD